jgi:hypothetical protein
MNGAVERERTGILVPMDMEARVAAAEAPKPFLPLDPRHEMRGGFSEPTGLGDWEALPLGCIAPLEHGIDGQGPLRRVGRNGETSG